MHSSLLSKRNRPTTYHSSIPALQTLDTSGETSTPVFIVKLHFHCPTPFPRPLLLIPLVHSSQTKSHPFASQYSLVWVHTQPVLIHSRPRPTRPSSQSSLPVLSPVSKAEM